MILFALIKRILISLVPILVFYFLNKLGKEKYLKKNNHLSDLDSATDIKKSKSKIVEGDIV